MDREELKDMHGRSRRFAILERRAINQETFVHEWPEVGLIAMDSPLDPRPSLRVEDGRIVEMDGRRREQFDLIDRFIADYAIDLEQAEEAMSMDSLTIARRLVDVNVSRSELLSLLGGCTPARLVEIVGQLNVVEMMMALQKMRARQTPANQAHVTNWKEHPALLAADAAEAAWRGFAEEETTVRVARNAPFNALAILIGSQTGRGGVLTQCAVEEALGLRLAIKGLTSYAETLSVYGTVPAFVDGDDTPWSKAFLASAYASRGVKVRFTSGTGSEVLMGHAEGKSMLYLEARCLMMVKGAGSQGVQNGSISCIALPESLPGGVRAVLAENLIASMLGLEVASGNDAMASHSDIRKAAKLMLQFLPGTDFITSGYGSIPRRDNLFGGGNFDAEDFDDWLVLQRDMRVDGGMRPVREEDVLQVRNRAARALQAVYEELGFPPITDAEVEAAMVAHSSDDMPDRNAVLGLAAADKFLAGPLTVVDVIRALDRRGFSDVAARVLEMQRQRMAGDYLQPSAIFDASFHVLSALNDPNDYHGPGTGYRPEGERWRELSNLPQAKQPEALVSMGAEDHRMQLTEVGPAQRGDQTEVVIAVGPGFGTALHRTLAQVPLADVLRELMAGVADEGLPARVIKVYRTSDCAAIGYEGAHLSGSGVAIGIQSKGTTVIHHKDLAPLNNLELFPQAPSLTPESYRAIGRNAARYAKGEPTTPVPVAVDNMARLRLIVHTTLMHLRATQEIRPNAPSVELQVKFL
jgi:propanediol dehydratase large subunit